jgi:hypothetical protein
MKWFTVVKVPLLRVVVDRQVMLYTVTGRIEYSAFILFPAPHPSFIDKVLELSARASTLIMPSSFSG